MGGSTSTLRTSARDGRLGIVVLGVMFLPAGFQAALFPQSFYDDFPVGRGWIAATGDPYSEHLVRDVGALFLALVVVSLWTWVEPRLARPVAAAWLVQGLLHLTYHVGHLDGLDGMDEAAMLGSLIIVPILALATLATAGRAPA